MKILITGFAPFGADERNASWDAVSMLPDRVDGAVLIKRQLPVEYDTVSEVLSSLLAREKPNAVICVGQAGGRSAVTPEKVTINWKHCGQRGRFICWREDPSRWTGRVFFHAPN